MRTRKVEVCDILARINEQAVKILEKTLTGHEHKFCVRGVVCTAKPVKNGAIKTIDVYFNGNVQRFVWNSPGRAWSLPF